MTVLVCVPTFGDVGVWGPLAQTAMQSTPEGWRVAWAHGQTLSFARNWCARFTYGETHLCFLDADDELCAGFGEAMDAAIARDPEADVFVPSVSVEHRAMISSPVPWVPGGDPFERTKSIVGSVIRASAFWRLGGFPEREPWGEDVELWLMAQLAGLRFVSVPDAVYIAHWREGSRGQHPRSREVWEDIVRTHRRPA